MPTCTVSNKAQKKLDQSQQAICNTFAQAVGSGGFAKALTTCRVGTGGQKKIGKDKLIEVYLFGKSGNPVPPRAWMLVKANGDVEIQDVADHRGH